MKWMRFSLWRTCTEERRRLKTENIEVRKRRGANQEEPRMVQEVGVKEYERRHVCGIYQLGARGPSKEQEKKMKMEEIQGKRYNSGVGGKQGGTLK